MDVSSQESRCIEEALAAWLAAGSATPSTRALAREARVLPVAIGPEEGFGVRTDGEVVRWSVRDDAGIEDVVIEPDPRLRRWVLHRASRGFAALADLAPRPPSDAAPCPQCAGSGVEPDFETRDARADCLLCGGVGWRPSDRDA
jgi:hypothetical protein